MTVPGDPHDELLLPLFRSAASALPSGTEWLDVHTHTGANDSDGLHCTAEELLAGLDRAGHMRAVHFTMHEPGGYPEANDRVLAEAAGSGGRLTAFCRIDPNAADALPEARRCLDAGAAGIKLHPRSDRFVLSHPAVQALVGLAAERAVPVLFHAGRGIPSLGQDELQLARRHPETPLILAHACVADSAWLWRELDGVTNLYFDTSWWTVADMLILFARVPPGQILYASDMPYGSALMGSLIALRPAREVGLGPEALAAIVGGQARRLLAGDKPLDLGPAPGPPARASDLNTQRATQHMTGAVTAWLAGGDPRQGMQLARSACAVPDSDPAAEVLHAVDRLAAAALEAYAPTPTRWAPQIVIAVAAALVAGTPAVPV